MKKPLWNWSTAARLLGYAAIVALVYAALLSLAGCELLTSAARLVGVSPSAAALEQAAKVDQALSGWVYALLGIGGSETARATHRVAKRRRERRKASREAEARVAEIVNPGRS